MRPGPKIWQSILALSALVSALALPGTARASEPNDAVEQAKEHFGRGVAFYKEGDLDGALAEFQKAYETRRDYRVLYNIGQVQAERHDHVAALQALREYLAEGGAEIESDRRASVQQSLQDLAKRVGTVTVTADVADADVVVDGVRVATVPLAQPLAVNAGIREITVRKAGVTAPARRLTVAGGDSLRVEFHLASSAGELAAPTPGAAPAHPRIRKRVWISYGVAAALGAAAATFGVLAHGADRDLSADLDRFPGNRGQIDDDRSRLRSRARLTDGFAAGALVAATVGTYFLLSGSSETESPAPAAPAAQISLLPSGAALSLSGSF